ncbi:hypothetical protein COV16_02670 [Candidatus Woesearchaeota archaeon CG10_big_fil_rev_8_21_14_0_10_34_8]|nr:MAG: hypothetical protein COV16_02670 [Candidatus Woesearchaeota archaeon CG10_big_fil_rev_8_21_14_0_10_34_8]
MPEDPCLGHNMKEDIIYVLQNAKTAISNKNVYTLREESNHIIHCATVFQSQEPIQTAVIIHALAKIMSRGETITPEILEHIQKAIEFIKVDNLRGFNNEIKILLKTISTIDKHLSNYMQHVITEARIKKGYKIYEHGISLRQTAEIFGLSQWELMKYIGKTKTSEYVATTIPIEKRLAFARTLFE